VADSSLVSGGSEVSRIIRVQDAIHTGTLNYLRRSRVPDTVRVLEQKLDVLNSGFRQWQSGAKLATRTTWFDGKRKRCSIIKE
jgi:hypothetical protein